MVASVAKVRLLVVVMRSVKQTGYADQEPLSAMRTAVDGGQSRTEISMPPAVTRADRAERSFTTRSASSS